MEPPFFVKGKLGLCVSVVTPVAVFMRIGGPNDTGRDGCSRVEPVIVRDASGLSMRAEVGGGGRTTVLRPLARRCLLPISFLDEACCRSKIGTCGRGATLPNVPIRIGKR